MINTKKAFSFIEVIIASSIIVIISVVAATNYSGMQDKTTNSKVLSDIQTLNNSILAYNKAKSEYPDPKGNQKFFGSNGEYKHAKDSDFVFGVSGFVSNNVIPKEFMNYLPIDPRTNQYYAYAKTIETNTNIKKQGFQIGGVVLENNNPKSLISGNYTGEQGPLDIIKDYTSPEFVPNDSTSLFPYNPEERVLVGKIQKASNIAQVSVNGVLATANMQVGQGDLVKVSSGNTVEIYYSDGTSALLGDTTQDTVLHLTNLSYKEENNLLTNISQILKSGNILVKASSLDQGDTDSEFNVYTEDVVASVRGTIFNVNANTNQDTVTVIEGTVDVNPTPTEVKNEIKEFFNTTDSTSSSIQKKEIKISLPEEIENTGSGKTIEVEKGGVPEQINATISIQPPSLGGVKVGLISKISDITPLTNISTSLNSIIPNTASGIIQEVTKLQTEYIAQEKISFNKEIDADKLSSEVLNEPLSGTGYIKVNGLKENTEIVFKYDNQETILTNTGINILGNNTVAKNINGSTYIKYSFGSDQINQICKNITITQQENCKNYGMESIGTENIKCTSCKDEKIEISQKKDTIIDVKTKVATKINTENAILNLSKINNSFDDFSKELILLDGDTIIKKIELKNSSNLSKINLKDYIKDGENINKACIYLSGSLLTNPEGEGYNKIGDNLYSNCEKVRPIVDGSGSSSTTVVGSGSSSTTGTQNNNLTIDNFNIFTFITNEINNINIKLGNYLDSNTEWKYGKEKKCYGGKIFKICRDELIENRKNDRNYLILKLKDNTLLKYKDGTITDLNNRTIKTGLTNDNINLTSLDLNGKKISKVCRDTWLYLEPGMGVMNYITHGHNSSDYEVMCSKLGSGFKFNRDKDRPNYTNSTRVWDGGYNTQIPGDTENTQYILCSTCD